MYLLKKILRLNSVQNNTQLKPYTAQGRPNARDAPGIRHTTLIKRPGCPKGTSLAPNVCGLLIPVGHTVALLRKLCNDDKGATYVHAYALVVFYIIKLGVA